MPCVIIYNLLLLNNEMKYTILAKTCWQKKPIKILFYNDNWVSDYKLNPEITKTPLLVSAHKIRGMPL